MWIEKKSDKYVSHDLQNEVISIMANQLHRDLVRDISNSFFSIITDEYTDVSNNEQLVICLRWIDQNIDAHEDFFWILLYPKYRSWHHNISYKGCFGPTTTVVVPVPMLSQGQCYDGASNMLGKRSGVAQ